jgi:hypothetical protein
VSLLSEGVPPLRSSSERRDALRRFLGEGSPALREDLQAVGDPVWPPPLVGLAVLVDEGALAVRKGKKKTLKEIESIKP